MTPTTRRHPRTLAEAFLRPPKPCTVIAGPYRRRAGWVRRLAPWLIWAGLIALGMLAR